MRLKGEISLEAAIVVPVVLLVIASSVYITLFMHDGISVEAMSYGYAVKANAEQSDPGEYISKHIDGSGWYVLNNNVKVYEGVSKTELLINSKSKLADVMAKLMNIDNKRINVEKIIDSQTMYLIRAMMDTVERK